MHTFPSRRRGIFRALAVFALALTLISLSSTEASARVGRGRIGFGRGYYARGHGGHYGPRVYNRGYHGGYYRPRYYGRGYYGGGLTAIRTSAFNDPQPACSGTALVMATATEGVIRTEQSVMAVLPGSCRVGSQPDPPYKTISDQARSEATGRLARRALSPRR